VVGMGVAIEGASVGGGAVEGGGGGGGGGVGAACGVTAGASALLGGASPVTLILQSWVPACTVSPSGMNSSSTTPETGEGTGMAVWW
jgi:hypothetical protein